MSRISVAERNTKETKIQIQLELDGSGDTELHTASVSSDPLLVADRLPDRISQHDSRVFHCMMAVHLQISIHMDLQIKKTMTAHAGSIRVRFE